MASISQVARLLGTDRETVRRWCVRFAEYLSLTASKPQGKARQFTDADLRVLALVAEFWEDEPDYENIHAMLNCGEQDDDRFMDFAGLHTPIFQDVPDAIDETWEHGVMIGGMAMRDRLQLARAYKQAADALVTQALSHHEAEELAYPIIFQYRHCIELYIKALLKAPPENHDLNGLMLLLQQQVGRNLVPWIADRVREFHDIDQTSDVFRYAGGPSCNELWIDLHQLKTVMDRLAEAFESHIDSEPCSRWRSPTEV